MNTRTVRARAAGPEHLLEAPGHPLVLLGEAAELVTRSTACGPARNRRQPRLRPERSPGRRPARDRMSGSSMTCSSLRPRAAPLLEGLGHRAGAELGLEPLLPRMLFPWRSRSPDFPARMSLSVCGVPHPRSPESIKRRRGPLLEPLPRFSLPGARGSWCGQDKEAQHLHLRYAVGSQAFLPFLFSKFF